MYNIQKGLKIILLAVLNIVLFSACETCAHGTEKKKPKTPINIPKPTKSDDKDDFKNHSPKVDEQAKRKEESSEEEDDTCLTTDDTTESIYISSLKKELEELNVIITSTEKVADYKLQNLLKSSAIAADVQEKIKEEWENLQEINKNKQYAGLVYTKIMYLVDGIVLQDNTQKDLPNIIEALKVDLKSLKTLAVKALDIGTECEIATIANRIDNKFKKLLTHKSISIELREKIKQMLKEKQHKQQARGLPVAELYIEIVNLAKTAEKENINLTENFSLILADIQSELELIDLFERHQRRTEVLKG